MNRSRIWMFAALGAGAAALSLATTRPPLSAQDDRPRFQTDRSIEAATLLAAARDVEVEAVAELVFTEGPACDADGSVYFTEITNNRIMRWKPGAGKAHVFLEPSNRANGLCFDLHGDLIACEGMEEDEGATFDPGRKLVRINVKTKERTVLASSFNGKKFNCPNDLCVDSKGNVWFTDPYYGGKRDKLEQDCEAVYRVGSDGKNLVRVLGAKDVSRPNGIGLSPDEKTLYVVDNKPENPSSRVVLAFDLSPTGEAGNRRVLFDFARGRGGDGMSVDLRGNLYVAAGCNRPYPGQTTQFPAGVYVFSPKGVWLDTIRIPEDMCTNCCFGGKDGRTLYVTAGKTLFSIRNKIPGHNVWPKQ